MLVLLAVVMAACTTEGGPDRAPTPTPTPQATSTAPPITGPRVAVVRPPGQTVFGNRQRSAEAVARVRSSFTDQLSEIRDVVAEPASFLPEVVALMADDGYDLVCAVGPGGLDAVLATADDYPRTRFCVVPAVAADVPGNVLVVDVAVEEPAFIAGATAIQLAPQAPAGLVGSRSVYAFDRREAGFRAGVDSRAPPAESPAPRGEQTQPPAGQTEPDNQPPQVLVGLPADDVEAARSLATTQYDAGAVAVYAAAGRTDEGVLAAAVAAGRGAIGVFEPNPDEDPERSQAVLVGFQTRLEPVLRVAIDRLLGEWSAEPVRLGFADGVFALVEGGHPRSAAALRTAEAIVEQIVAGDSPVPGGT